MTWNISTVGPRRPRSSCRLYSLKYTIVRHSSGKNTTTILTHSDEDVYEEDAGDGLIDGPEGHTHNMGELLR